MYKNKCNQQIFIDGKRRQRLINIRDMVSLLINQKAIDGAIAASYSKTSSKLMVFYAFAPANNYNQVINYLMSYFVEDSDIYPISNQQPPNPPKSQQHSGTNGKYLETAPLHELLPKQIKNPNSTLLSLSSSCKSVYIWYSIANFYKNIQAVACIYLNMDTLALKIDFKLIDDHNNYLSVQSRERQKIIFKHLSKKQSYREFNIIIHPITGLITISAPHFYFAHEVTPLKLGKCIERELRGIRNSVKSNFKVIDSILQICEVKGSQLNSSVHNPNFVSLLKHYDYIKLMNLQLCLASQATDKEQSLNNRWKKEKQSLSNIQQGLVNTDTQIRPLQLYSYSPLAEFEDKQFFGNILNIITEQRLHIQEKIKLPSLSKVQNSTSQENHYVLNYVLINDKYSLSKYRQINRGGFTQIYLTELIYWYIGSCGFETTSEVHNITSKPPLKKYMIVKHQNEESLKSGERSRVEHQKHILKNIKNGVSIFLCKYYFAENHPQLKDDLLSDYIDFPNFSDYCNDNAHSMSLHTKIYFGIMIAQSLRYLQDYKIVHLDLKPSNIMLGRKLSIKLIDFGQSYHPDLGKHLPGFSMPYSAPQNYCHTGQFTFKQDVFSLAIIMFELLFGKLPFFFHSATLKQRAYSQRNFYDYIFFCPQECRLGGQQVVLPLMQAIVMKCLQPNPGERSQLQWIVFILKQCLSYFY